MKRILITTGIFPPDIGGPASYGRTLAQKLSKKYEVTVLAYSRRRSYADDKQMGFPVRRVWKRIPKYLRNAVYFFKALSLARKHDIVFALNAVSAGLPACVAAHLYKKKFFIKIVGDYSWEIAVNKGKTTLLINDFQNYRHGGWIGVLRRLQAWVCRQADGIIVPSEYLAGIVRGWGIDAGRIHVVYNGAEFKPANIGREEARKKIGIPGNLLVSVGRLVPWKGFRMLVKIMPQLLEINQFFRLVIVGSGPDMKILQTMVRNLGLERKVFLTGEKTQDELAVYLASADIFVLNSGYEGFSHQLLEAMIAGAPIITTAVGGNREIINQGENGFMVKYNDEFNLIEAIKTLWKMSELREQFVNEGKETVRHFSVTKMYDETIRLLAS